MSQNNMIAFITLTDTELNPVEINPAFIMMMQRVHNQTIPCTKLTLSFNNTLCVLQTPEEIASRQMDSMSKVMESVMQMTKEIVEGMENDW